jgi:hypothetical protein
MKNILPWLGMVLEIRARGPVVAALGRLAVLVGERRSPLNAATPPAHRVDFLEWPLFSCPVRREGDRGRAGRWGCGRAIRGVRYRCG